MDQLLIADAGHYRSMPRGPREASALREVLYEEIELFCSDGTASHVDGSTHIVQKGDVLIARPGQMRYTTGYFETLYVRFSCPDTAFAAKYLHALPPWNHLRDDNALIAMFRELIRAHTDKGFGDELLVQAKLYEIISYLNRIRQVAWNVPAANYTHIDEAARYIQTHYDQALSLGELAERYSWSPTYFHTMFKSVIGQTPTAYLRAVRISAAKNLLLTTAQPLADIAAACGFGDQSYFSHVFRAECGISPLQYRKNGIRPFWNNGNG